jgi:FtsH-binding integral membrane protein
LLFSIHSIPELAHVPPDERTRLWRRAVAQTRGGCALTAGVAFLFAAGMGTMGRFAKRATSDLGEFVAMVAGACVVGVLVGLLLVNFTYRRARKQLRAELRDRTLRPMRLRPPRQSEPLPRVRHARLQRGTKVTRLDYEAPQPSRRFRRTTDFALAVSLAATLSLAVSVLMYLSFGPNGSLRSLQLWIAWVSIPLAVIGFVAVVAACFVAVRGGRFWSAVAALVAYALLFAWATWFG